MGRAALRMGTVDVPPWRVHCHLAGRGQALVLVPSMLVLARTYLPLVDRLSRHFRVWVPEMPGTGWSSRVRRPLAMAEHAKVVLGVLDAVGIDRAILVGHSNSGPVVVHAALAAPDRVAALILVDTIGGRPDDRLPRVLAARFVDALLEPRLTVRGTPHILLNATRHFRTFVHQVRAAASVEIDAVLDDVRAPVLLAWGRGDHTEPLDCARRLQRAHPGAAIAIGPGSHDWLVEQPDAFCRVVRGFVHGRGERGAEEC